MPNSSSFTSQDLLLGGSALAAIQVEEAEFEAVIHRVNARFGLSVEPRPEALELLRDRLRFVAGRHWQETQQVDRKSIDVRLRNLARHVAGVRAALQPVRLGLQDERDMAFINFLAQVVAFRHGKMTGSEARTQIETILKVVESLQGHCEHAQAVLAHIPAKAGRRALGWYDSFVELMVAVAGTLEVPITTRGTSQREPEETPFTILVFAVEKFLPREAWSNSVGACAKRVQASLKTSRVAAGKNESTN